MKKPKWYNEYIEDCDCEPCYFLRAGGVFEGESAAKPLADLFPVYTLEAGQAVYIPTPKMKVIESENVIPFDVDDTLILWDRRDGGERILVVDPSNGLPVLVEKHKPHIELLKKHKARGKFIIVWSQGGFAWAEAVVKALGLEQYVDICMTKPAAYVDDLPVDAWLKDRIYIKPESNWGLGLEKDK